jgi:pimeloyl-ACP methyl ester carboxylesterase
MRMTTWKKVFREVAAFTTAVAYNRAGFGRSSRAEAPRHAASIVCELRAFLQDAGFSPPYVLVGHSLGGLYMQLFARLHPDEAAGLVLVDPTPPFLDIARQRAEKQSPLAAVWGAVLGRITKAVHALVGRAAMEELAAIDQSAQAVLQAPTTALVPTIILISARKSMLISRRHSDTINDIQRGLLRLFPGCQWRSVDCGHAIHVIRPETVVAAIREFVSPR